jgi:hypothetical protein
MEERNMQIQTENGILDTQTLPETYEPCFCSKCGCRLGWMNIAFLDAAQFNGLCDSCAAIVSQDA